MDYIPRPLPTMPPSFNPGQTMFDGVDQTITKVTDVLASVPIIPNSQGLFDPATGEWLPPVLSALDVLIAFVIIGTTFSLILRLSGLSGNYSGSLINYAKNSR